MLSPNDNTSSTPINITSVFGPQGLFIGGQNYTRIFVNENGNLSFTGPVQANLPAALATQYYGPMIAPFWANVITTGGALTSPGGASQGTNRVYYDLDTEARAFTATWDDVGVNGSGARMAFQVRLTDAGHGDFDIAFLYEDIGVLSPTMNGAPRAGFNLGRMPAGQTNFEMPGSGNVAQMMETESLAGNTGLAGLWTWHIRSGVVTEIAPPPPPPEEPPPEEPPILPPPPEPPEDEEPIAVVVGPSSGGVSFSISQVGIVREGDVGVTPYAITILRSGDGLSSPSVVQWEIVLDDPADLAPGQPLSGTTVFGPGVRSVTVTIGIAGDKIPEEDEPFEFRLASATHGTVTMDPGVSGMGIIVNDDAPVAFDFTGPQIGAEGLTGVTPFEFTVIRTGDLRMASTVQWQLQYGQADGEDFAPGQPTSGAITFAPGSDRATIAIDVAGDTRLEPDESFSLRLTTAQTGTITSTLTAAASGTILDDDLRQSLLVAASPSLIQKEGNDGSTAFTFNLLRTGDLTGATKVAYTINLPTTGGLGAGEIQTALTGEVTFAAGSAEGTLRVLVSGDTTPEDNETFAITLGGGVFNTLTLTGVVMNDDQAPGAAQAAAPSVTAGSASQDEASAFFSQVVGGGLWSGPGEF